MPLSEVVPSSTRIDKLITKMEEGDIKIPAFQRGFVWTQDQVIELLDSIYCDYPIGSILLWNSIERLKSTRNLGGFLIPEREPQYPINYVLDGQQRLSVIYAVFCKDRTRDSQNTEYDVDPKVFDIYFDLDDSTFLAEEDLLEAHTNLRMNTLFDVNKFFQELQPLDEGHREKACDLQSRFQNYEVPIITTTRREKEEVGIIFERINNTGTQLTTLDLMIAWTWEEGFHLREEIDEILEILERKGFGNTQEKVILQSLAGIIRKTTRTKDIIGLRPDEVRTNIEKLRTSLEKTIDFLATELNVSSQDFLPHSHQIVPLAFIFSSVTTPSHEQCRILKQWFWKTSFSKRYSGSTDIKMNDDIAFFDRVLSEDYSDISRYSYSIDSNTLINQTFSKSNPFTRSFLLLLAQKQPSNLVNGNRIDLGEALSRYNSKEYHHIFPRAFLKNKGEATSRINSLCNFCFLPTDSNKAIAARSPSDYMINVVPKSKYRDILSSNLMPLKKDVYLNNQYDEFLRQRAEIVLQFLDSQIES